MRHFLLILVAVLFSSLVDAQVRINLNLNIESQPIWGPTGYDHVEYYYLPDIGVYYSVPQQKYYSFEGGRWIGRASLPPRYRGYDLYNSYKVVINEPTPYLHDKANKEKYSSFKGRHDQHPIRDSHESRYFANKNHPEHNTWVKQQKHDTRDDNKKGHGDKSVKSDRSDKSDRSEKDRHEK